MIATGFQVLIVKLDLSSYSQTLLNVFWHRQYDDNHERRRTLANSWSCEERKFLIVDYLGSNIAFKSTSSSVSFLIIARDTYPGEMIWINRTSRGVVSILIKSVKMVFQLALRYGRPNRVGIKIQTHPIVCVTGDDETNDNPNYDCCSAPTILHFFSCVRGRGRSDCSGKHKAGR